MFTFWCYWTTIAVAAVCALIVLNLGLEIFGVKISYETLNNILGAVKVMILATAVGVVNMLLWVFI